MIHRRPIDRLGDCSALTYSPQSAHVRCSGRAAASVLYSPARADDRPRRASHRGCVVESAALWSAVGILLVLSFGGGNRGCFLCFPAIDLFLLFSSVDRPFPVSHSSRSRLRSHRLCRPDLLLTSARLQPGRRLTHHIVRTPPSNHRWSAVRPTARLTATTHIVAAETEEEDEEDDEDDNERSDTRHQPASDSVVRLLYEHCDELRFSIEQHHIRMRYYWQDGLLGEEEDELRVKYAAGVRAPINLSAGQIRADGGSGSSGYRVFKRVQTEGEEDGRNAFFRPIETKGRNVSSGEARYHPHM